MNREQRRAFAKHTRHQPVAADFVNTALQAAASLAAAGKLHDAASAYRRVLVTHPGNAVAHSNLGCVLTDLGKLEESERHLKTAIELRPGFADAYLNLASLMLKSQRYGEAEQLARRCVTLEPKHSKGWINLGGACRAQGKFGEAKEHFLKATQLDANNAKAWALLGDAYVIALDLLPAKECFEKALALDKNNAVALVGMGVVLANARLFGHGMVSILRGLGQDFRNVNAWTNLGAVLNSQGRVDEARQAYQMAAKLDPENAAAKFKLATTTPWIVSSKEDMERRHAGVIEDLRALKADAQVTISNPLLQVNFTNFQTGYYGLNEIDINRGVAEVLIKKCPELDWTAPHCSAWSKPTRPRIGLITAFTKDHIVADLFRAIHGCFDRSRFEVLPFVPLRRFRASSSGEDPLPGTVLPSALYEAREVIARARLDVMFFLDTFVEPLIYYLSFARLAPIQCTTWGHPITTGLPHMDYFISARDWESDDADAHYTERLVRLRELPMYVVKPPAPDKDFDRAGSGIPPDAKVYTCLQSLFKLHPDFDDALGGLLRRDPRGVVALLTGEDLNWNTLFAERFNRKYPDVTGRLLFMAKLPRRDYLAFLKDSDAILDPFHWGGGNTTIEALACGVPVPTLPGAYLRGRLTLGFYRKMGLPELIANDTEHFVELNYRIANDRDFRAALQAKIAERLPLLYENVAAIRELEAFFIEALDRKAKANTSGQSRRGCEAEPRLNGVMS